MIFAVPIGYLYYLTLRDEAGEPPQLVGRMFTRGAVYGLVVALLLLLIRRIWDPAQAGQGLFWYLAFHDFWIPTFVLTALYLLSSSAREAAPSERRTALVSLLAGGFTLLGVLDIWVLADYQGLYELFLLPGLRLAIVISVPLLLSLFNEETFWTRYLYLSASLLVPLLPGLVGLLVFAGYGSLGMIAGFVLLGAAYAAAIFVGGGSRSAVFW
jgi:hypothetical protein